ncbi:elongation factor Tu family protein [Theileria equi strain WA]|uniref:Elongation factor Tu family protein n=1 Tax=Theileria equi strain WA TaxID=1537102 RepID=L1LGU6_THEEQ|nr:elongation factor Tu family protein [Theileria equi strain WA]EKX74343.1 elongation factor Tu family protein [Theileria equi strain WA]|eukprot:XP_004833795.1 elongation factor Tu family protein [Theileria equi strain WA]
MKDVTDVLGLTENIRNVCFLAHVDHGKTTLSDSLISSVGIISERLSGKLRYLDNRDDEQRRMITIKSSSISLLYSKPGINSDKNTKETTNHSPRLINLVDSPGHVDFSVEVSTAARLCDGALLIVDVVEGICPQTKAVLRQAWHENVKTVLVLNKLDKLILGLHMTPLEAYRRMYSLVEQANALIYQLYMEEVIKNEDLPNITKSEKWFYSPAEGNVAFCSAIHRWCIYIPEFVCQVANKLGISQNKVDALQKALWGGYYFCNKTKSVKVCKGDEKPMFVQFVLQQIWTAYDAIISWNTEYITKLVTHSSTKLSTRQLKLLENPKLPSSDERDELLQAIMSNWLPLCSGMLRLIVDSLPDPSSAARKRLKKICPAILSYEKYDHIIQSHSSAPVVVHIAKFLGSDLRHMRLTRDVLQGDERAGDFIAFSRVFSGTVRRGDWLYICNSTAPTNDSEPEQSNRLCVLKVMILMGADLIDVDAAFSGNIVALLLSETAEIPNEETQNLKRQESIKDVMAWLLSLADPHRSRLHTSGEYNRSRISRTGTLCSVDRHLTLSSDPNFPPFSPPTCEFNNSIIRVSVEPQHVKDMNQLLIGLALLYTADPAVEFDILKTGEYVLACCGEIHLERCINDLVNLYAKIPINVSKLRVSIREGIVDLNYSDNKGLSYSSALSVKVNFPPWKNTQTEELPTDRDCSTDKGQFLPVSGIENLFITADAVAKGTEYSVIGNGDVAIFLKTKQMSSQILKYLDDNSKDIKGAIYSGDVPLKYVTDTSSPTLTNCLNAIEEDLYSIITGDVDSSPQKKNYGKLWGMSLNRGSRCLLFYNRNSCIYTCNSNAVSKENMTCLEPLNWSFADSYGRTNLSSIQYSNLITNLISGFEMACQSGPITEEPLRGVIFIIEGIYIAGIHKVLQSTSEPRTPVNKPSDVSKLPDLHLVISDNLDDSYDPDKFLETHGLDSATLRTPSHTFDDKSDCAFDHYSIKISDSCTLASSRRSTSYPFSGKLMSSMRSLCRKAYMQRGRPRIYEVILHLDLQCDQSVLGKIYSVLQKRRTQVISENVKDGTTTFIIEATMPASESFGLAQDLRSKASGGVIFHLQFSHWELILDDPFPEVSMTDEVLNFLYERMSQELEDDGFNMALMLQSNVPRKIINHIRKIKVIYMFTNYKIQGLPTEEKIVHSAEKQRTLSTKK